MGYRGKWQELSFLDNLAAAVDALGFDKVGIAWGVAKTPFESVQDREAFLNTIVARDARAVEDMERRRA